MHETAAHWWRVPLPALLQALHTGPQGLTQGQAAARLRRHGPNRLRPTHREAWPRRLLARLLDPLTLVLIVASLISAATGDAISFGFVAVMVLLSVSLDLLQEHRAGRAVEALQHTVGLRARVWRQGRLGELAAHHLVPGDCVELSAGSLVPADGRVLSANAFFVNEASLTGEAVPVEKQPLDEPPPAAQALGCAHTVLMGSSVVSGSARVLICATGMDTELGGLQNTLAAPAPLTAFERGTRQFGLTLTRATLVLVLVVLFINVLYQRPMLESFLFAVALAVGLTPELLPMIVSVTLARGAVRLSARQVIVKRLSAVQDLGAMDVLCTDKTGTLTQARLRVERVLAADGNDSAAVFELAWLNSRFETGLKSPLDDAILAHGSVAEAGWRKLDEVPFDFERRRVSVLIEREGERLLIAKGAPEDVLRLCAAVELSQGVTTALDEAGRTRLTQLFDEHSAQGLRLLAVAKRRAADASAAPAAINARDEHDFVFAGFIAFSDPPKASAAAALVALQAQGVAVKIVTGDNEAVTRHLCEVLGLPVTGVLTGAQIAAMDDAALRAAAVRAELFCRVTPEQKNRIVRALQAGGRVVGYLGDGINDAPPLHSADVGISVDSAVDVAKHAADLVLLRNDLGVLSEGVSEGRRTAVNVNKYVLMATSSNFGNMVSMAAAALFLPFLPMLPVQILLNNFLYDVSELAIPIDRVAAQDLLTPRRWDVSAIRRFMWTFGLLSSVFDLSAFWLLHGMLHVPQPVFQTAWFVQSLVTQVLVIFVIRTPRAAWRDAPSPALTIGSLGVAAFAFAVPFLPWSHTFGFTSLPLPVLGLVVTLGAGYLVAAEALKHWVRRD